MTGGAASAQGLDAASAALVRAAAALVQEDEGALRSRLGDALAAGVPDAWLHELVLAAVLFAGFPRALVAAAALRTAAAPAEGAPREAPAPGDAADYARWREWQQRGEETCRRIYGSNYHRLRANVRALHPALDAWIITDGYGRTLSRPGLDLVRRELCAIAMLVPQGVPRQLHSHFRGALNVGASVAQIEATLDTAATVPGIAPDRLDAARRVWAEVRPT